MNKRLILASTSPYRASLLERLMLSFDKIDSEVDEDQFKEKISNPRELTKTLAFEKANSVFKKNPKAFVIGGDQVSLFGQEVLGKPGSFDRAVDQLMKLQGKTHQLVTSTCVLGPDSFEENWTEITTLSMRKLSEEECASYVRKDDPLFCAGSYKIESLGISLFEKIEGEDQTAIIGMPLMRLTSVLRKTGFIIP